jgi:hypothetical protein
LKQLHKSILKKIQMHIGRMVLGRFGGNTFAGQYKNEDGCLLRASEK